MDRSLNGQVEYVCTVIGQGRRLPVWQQSGQCVVRIANTGLNMFDVLLREIGKKFGLGQQVNALLGMLLSVIYQEKNGALAGFIDQFRQKGLLDLVNSWLGRNENRGISVGQLETVMGTEVLAEMAKKLGLGQATVSSALSYLLPNVIDKLSPDGVIPASSALPSGVRSYLVGYESFAQEAGLLGRPAAGAARAYAANASGRSNATIFKIVPWLLLPLMAWAIWYWANAG
jgi:OmpA-OmpF porin, OOP family